MTHQLASGSATRRFGVALLLGGWLATTAWSHGIPLVVRAVDSGSRLEAFFVPQGEFENEGGEVVTSDPGIGVLVSNSPPPVGTTIELEVLRELLYWDGAAMAPTTASLTINTPGAAAHAVTSDSDRQTGIAWAEYPGVSSGTWDAHGLFELESSGGETPEQGLYGIALRLTSPTLLPSDPFVLPFRFGSLGTSEVSAGLAAFDAALAEPTPGDFNGDGLVDNADLAFWSDEFGSAITPGTGADGSGDGVVDAADYTVWRDALASASAATIPEPSTAAILLLATATWARRRA